MDSAPETSDVFSLSDHHLAERLHFVKEIGFGNWGSVWLCRPKSSSGRPRDVEVAVKLVHRSKTPTTAARVRSLWNEMKIVRSFKHDPHPSIIPFHSFIITPSYALITMAYLPALIPVEVSEPRAKEWFRSLLSGVHFLHSRGIVHNDIKPANVLLSRADIPVLVDFGFAEKYDLKSSKAFHSNLAYGTPEYLSPERARGLPHDTRKSDIWSLGVTFFEILVGRTPFEYEEGEAFEKKEDLERYWERTMRGRWVGSYSMSKSAEHILKRMIVPNADLRCTAVDLTVDPYWNGSPPSISNSRTMHKKSASATLPSSPAPAHSSLSVAHNCSKDREKDSSLSRLLNISLRRSGMRSALNSSASPPLSVSRTDSVPSSISRTDLLSEMGVRNTTTDTTSAASDSIAVRGGSQTALHMRSRSQPKLRDLPSASSRTQPSGQGRKLSIVQGSPVVKVLKHMESEAGSEEARKEGECSTEETHTRHILGRIDQQPQSISLRSISSLRRPHGPRQLSPRTVTGNAAPSDSMRDQATGMKKWGSKHHHAPSAHSQKEQLPGELLGIAPVQGSSPAHEVLFPSTPTTQATVSTPASKQMSGRPPRSRSRVRVLADLTGFARNVDLSAHGVDTNRPPKVKGTRARDDHVKARNGAENVAALPIKGRTAARKDERRADKKNSNMASSPIVTRTHVLADKGNLRSPSDLPGLHNQSQSQSLFQPQAKSTPKDHDISVASPSGSLSVLANLSNATNVTKGSVRDRMMDWERERERLREMNRLADAGDQVSTFVSDSCSDSASTSTTESEVVAEVNAATLALEKAEQVRPDVKEVTVNIELKRSNSPQTTTVSSVSSTPTVLTTSGTETAEKNQIEVAMVAVRAPAQILSSRSGLSVDLRQTLDQSTNHSCHEGAKADDNGLPTEVCRTSESALSGLKHSVKASIDKGIRLYKSSTLAQLAIRTTPMEELPSIPVPLDFESRRSTEGRFSWENIRPQEEIALDRMNLWVQSVERVVEETRQHFAWTSVTQPTPLPLVPVSRASSHQRVASTNVVNSPANNTAKSSRLPRRHLPANQIFAELTSPDAPLSPASQDRSSFSYVNMPESSCPLLPSLNVLAQTPPRQRRATISTRSPAQESKSRNAEIYTSSPSRREKSRSHGNLDRHIRDVTKLEMELDANTASKPSAQPLSAVLDKNLFVATPISARFPEDDDLNASPYHVEPYPPRKSGEHPVIASPERRHMEGVYDRFLMATAGVKRVGKGYQSDNFKPMQNTVSATDTRKTSANHSRAFGVFGSGKRQLPPPVSSDDIWPRSTSMDELGYSVCSAHIGATPRICRDDNKNTAALVKRAIKAMVPSKAASRRLPCTLIA